MDAPIFTLIGAVSGIAGIAGLFISLPNRKSRLVHFIYCASIALISATAIYYFSEIKNKESFERHVWSLLGSTSANDDRGFMLASLSLLETNKKLFPETYSAAKQLCKSAGITGEASAIPTKEGAKAMESLLQGLVDHTE